MRTFLAAALLLAGCTPVDDEGEAPDAPEQANAWRMLRRQDERGLVDPVDVRAARAQRAANAAHHAAQDDAGIGRYGWIERGPFNIGGRTRSLVIDPANPNAMWAGAVGGGVWRSTNGGASWAPVDDRLGNLAVCSLALVPGSPPTIYAGTGEGFYNGDALVGEGIFRSVDGGMTFTKLAGTVSFSYVNRIAVHPSNPSLLLAAVRPGGVFRSVDAGLSWTNVRAADNCLQVLFDPNDPTKATADVYEGGNHRVVYSTDGGATWTNAATGLVGQSGISGRIEMCYAQSAPGTIYASCGTSSGKVWRSTDGGASWTLRTGTNTTGAMWYYNSIWVDPFDANIVVVGAYHVYRSTDGGVTLPRISNGYIDTSQPHPDVHGFVSDPGYDGSANRRVYTVTDGGVYVANDIRTASRTSGWARRDSNYRASQFYGAAGDGATGRINGGTQDNGSLTLQNGASSAQLTYGGDGGFAAIDWTNPNYIYGEYVYATVHRSTNGGSSASNIYSGLSEANTSSTANFISPFVLDPSDPARLYVGCASLWRTSDARAATVAWSAIKPATGSLISAIAVAPSDPNVIWVGHNNGTVWRTANGLAASPAWVAVDANGSPNPLPNRYVNRILIDRTDPTVAYVALGGFSPDNLWRTANAGATFADLTGSGVTGLPNAPVYGICQHPLLADRLYAGTEVGAFASEDGGVTWSTSNDGPADTSVEEVVFLHGSTTLLLATHGRGLWTIDVREPAVTALGAGCAGTAGVPALAATPPRVGELLWLTCGNVPAGTFTWFVLGFDATSWNGNPLPMPLDPFGMPGCLGRVRPDLVDSGVATGTWRTLTVPIPADRGFAGFVFHAQALVADPGANAGGAVVSNALTLTIGH